jgi:ATP-dependent Lhr-like helicase
MGFFNMKGVDIVRIREILTKDVADIDEGMKKALEDRGYVFVNGFYAKGRFVAKTFTDPQIISYVMRKQHAVQGDKYQTVSSAVNARGYIRTDAEILTRVADRTSIKKQMECTGLVRTSLVPPYMGYTTMQNASIYRTVKDGTIDEDKRTILALITDRQPVSRKEIVSNSPLSEGATIEALNSLSHDSVVCQDHSSAYRVVPPSGMSKHDAMLEVVRMHFRDFGLFTAETLSAFMYVRMGVVRQMLAELEDDGTIVKGFFIKDDPTVVWMLKDDIDAPIRPLRDEMLLLNSQDNLHVYFRDMIKREVGSTDNVVFKGTKIIGSFKGKLTIAGAKIEDFQGSPEAKRYIKEIAVSLGVKIDSDQRKEEDRDWDVSEFYIKMNPGAI